MRIVGCIRHAGRVNFGPTARRSNILARQASNVTSTLLPVVKIRLVNFCGRYNAANTQLMRWFRIWRTGRKQNSDIGQRWHDTVGLRSYGRSEEQHTNHCAFSDNEANYSVGYKWAFRVVGSIHVSQRRHQSGRERRTGKSKELMSRLYIGLGYLLNVRVTAYILHPTYCIHPPHFTATRRKAAVCSRTRPAVQIIDVKNVQIKNFKKRQKRQKTWLKNFKKTLVNVIKNVTSS